MYAFITVSISFFGQSRPYPPQQLQETGMFAVLRLVSLRELCDLLLNFSGFHACTISFGGFDVRSGRKYGQSGGSGPTKMNINRG